MFRDGWVCAACWKPNRAQDDRCYACRTTRHEQADVELGSRMDQLRPASHLDDRMDAQIPVLAWLTAWPLRIAGGTTILFGSVWFVLVLLSSGEGYPPVFGLDAQLVAGLIALGVFLLGVLQVFVARSVQRHARWAYVVTLLIGLFIAGGRLLDLNPRTPLPSGAAAVVFYVSAWLYLAMAVLAAALLVASFVRRGDRQEPATPTN